MWLPGKCMQQICFYEIIFDMNYKLYLSYPQSTSKRFGVLIHIVQYVFYLNQLHYLSGIMNNT